MAARSRLQLPLAAVETYFGADVLLRLFARYLWHSSSTSKFAPWFTKARSSSGSMCYFVYYQVSVAHIYDTSASQCPPWFTINKIFPSPIVFWSVQVFRGWSVHSQRFISVEARRSARGPGPLMSFNLFERFGTINNSAIVWYKCVVSGLSQLPITATRLFFSRVSCLTGNIDIYIYSMYSSIYDI